jgi:Transposase, Mutator family
MHATAPCIAVSRIPIQREYRDRHVQPHGVARAHPDARSSRIDGHDPKQSPASRAPLPKVVRMLAEAEEDTLDFYAFPPAHWSKLRATNQLERFNREIGRGTDAVGIFLDDRSLIRLVGMLCLEQNDEWLVGRRCPSRAAMQPFLGKRLHRDTSADHAEIPALRRPEHPRLHRRGECSTPHDILGLDFARHLRMSRLGRADSQPAGSSELHAVGLTRWIAR